MQSYPFTSQVTYDEQGLPLYDRAVDSAFLRKVFAAYFSDGIFYKPATALQVVAGTGMQVQVGPGICHIQGAMGIEPNLRTLPLTAAGSQPRIDAVVARLDLSQAVRSIELYVKTGMPAASPSAPSLTRDSTTWELGLANIVVGANVGTISQSNITDTRLDTSRCGMVAQTIGTLDTSAYFAQLQQAMAEYLAACTAQIGALEDQIDAVEGNTAWMLKAVYDADGDGKVDDAKNGLWLYSATLLVDGWGEAASDGSYSQTVACTSVNGGPAVTADTVLSNLEYKPTGTQATDEALQEALGILRRGKGSSVAGGNVTFTVWELPTCDITVYMDGRAN